MSQILKSKQNLEISEFLICHVMCYMQLVTTKVQTANAVDE